jgi:predicted dehydrogenase
VLTRVVGAPPFDQQRNSQEPSVNDIPAALPRARTPDPRSAPGLRWGVLGTGWIADKFVSSLQRHSSQRVVAVGSRGVDSATGFAGRFGIDKAYGSYEELVADPGVDVVYVASPHNAHLPHALLALRAGKHTLVEKPLALNAVEAGQIADEARSRGLFCMEAYWTAFLPKYDVLRQLLDGHILGDVTAVVADFGEWFSAGHRIHRPELAGGPMLDLGTYLISFVLDVLGPPDQIIAAGTTTGSGVAGQTAMLLRRGDQQAVLHTTILANTPTRATIAGTVATIDIDGPFYQPGGFSVTTTDAATRLRYDEPAVAHQGLHYQAAEVARRIAAGETGSPLRPLSASIGVLRVIDEVRRQTGDRYPADDGR